MGNAPVRILTVLTYYDPHWTGLTAIAKRIAEGLVARGFDVTVLTTQYARKLPREELLNGVRVVRAPTAGRLSRGMLAPSLPVAAHRLMRVHDVVHIHTPLPEAPLVALSARLHRRPLVMTHQGDLVMPDGLVNQTIETIGTLLLTTAGRLATVVSPLNDDYARESRFLRRFERKTVAILPPVEIPEPDPAVVAKRRRELGLDGKRLVAFAGRFVEEKGFDRLLEAIPALRERVPDVHLVYAGEHRIAYEDFYARCRPLLERHRHDITFVGLLRDRDELASFYAMADVLALPSRTDSFAAVQVEAMLCGTPVVATNIPGARVVIQATGMGLLVAPGDPSALAAGLGSVLDDPAAFTRPRATIEAAFDRTASLDSYATLMIGLARRR
jgi:glycosyltransferase involved in cell wall biosynthesis